MNSYNQVILTALQKFPKGASASELRSALLNPPSIRTIQRHLLKLEEASLVRSTGVTRSKKFFLASTATSNLDQMSSLEQTQQSKECIEILSYIKQAISKRKPVTYHFEFLENYIPNKTCYLSEKLKSKLNEIGKSKNESKPAGTMARHIYNRLLIDLSYNSSRLEGNTYSLLDTEHLFNKNEVPLGKDLKDTQMVLNHKSAIEFIVNQTQSIQVDSFTILSLHSFLSDNLLTNSESCGKLRSIQVDIYGSVYIPLGIPQTIKQQFDLILKKASQIKDPFEQSFFLLLHLPYLQPFEDVNKRVSRLAANIPLIQNNQSPLSFVGVPEENYIDALLGVYELNRIDLFRDLFVWAYEKSATLYNATRESLGEPDSFRLLHRKIISETIHEIVSKKMLAKEVLGFIAKQSKTLPKKDQNYFAQVINKELIGLHEGNIARYHLRVKEYECWRADYQFFS